MSNVRVLVTGSRNYKDKAKMRTILYRVVTALNLPDDAQPVLVHGGARGADSAAHELWNYEWGWPVEVHEANWDEFGKAAGHIRNDEMAKLGADVCVAFPLGESKGTRGMMKLCKKYGITLIDASEISEEDLYA